MMSNHVVEGWIYQAPACGARVAYINIHVDQDHTRITALAEKGAAHNS